MPLFKERVFADVINSGISRGGHSGLALNPITVSLVEDNKGRKRHREKGIEDGGRDGSLVALSQ